MLQWGRDRAVAELFRPGSESRCLYSLQWGRDRAVAELPEGDRWDTTVYGLQWGRDRAVAELFDPSPVLSLQSGFNGAATARSRNFRESPRKFRSCYCFNGAATARSRNWANHGAGEARAIELQWGRDRAVAELPVVSARVRRKPVASMGPRPRGRGNIEELREIMAGCAQASMGPGPRGRGNSGRRCCGRR